MKRYLFYVTHAYSYSIMRPLQTEILRQGGEAAWFIEPLCANELTAEEHQLKTIDEVMQYRPIACFAPGNYIPDFFPGIKVRLGHGYAINKRNYATDSHFRIRGWFDLYCTQSAHTTAGFEQQARKYGHFRVYETGWSKADIYFSPAMQTQTHNERPTILYSSTFTPALTSTPILADRIEELVGEEPWDWIFMFHPKLTDPEILNRYRAIAERHPNATYIGNTFDFSVLQRADVLLCDSSSIILEFMFLDKPVVTFRNTQPGSHLLNITSVDELKDALCRAISRPDALMQQIRDFTLFHEPHRDCQCCRRILAAVDHFLAEGHKGLRRKPLNLVRKFQVRKTLGVPFKYWWVKNR